MNAEHDSIDVLRLVVGGGEDTGFVKYVDTRNSVWCNASTGESLSELNDQLADEGRGCFVTAVKINIRRSDETDGPGEDFAYGSKNWKASGLGVSWRESKRTRTQVQVQEGAEAEAGAAAEARKKWEMACSYARSIITHKRLEEALEGVRR